MNFGGRLRARRLLGRSLVALQEGRLVEAAAGFREYVALQPQSWAAWCSLGECQQALGLLPESEHSFQRCLALNPQSVEAKQGLALIYGERDGDWARCQELLEECLQKTHRAGVPEVAHLDLAWASYLREDKDRAKHHFAQALGGYVDSGDVEESPDFAAVEYRVGVLHHALHADADRARTHLRQAIRLSPESIYARRARELMEQLERW